MARKRQIDPIYPFEKEIRALSIPARFFYLLSWCYMSDPNEEKKKIGGVLPYDLFFLKNNIFPEENIDIVPIIEEIIAQRRYFVFESDGKEWLWCPTLSKHQTINHPSKGNYPDPPLEVQEYYRSTKVVLTQSRVEKSRVEKNKSNSPALQEAFNLIIKDGFNIYPLLIKTKKLLKQPAGFEFPEEVLLKVCEAYWREKATIRKPWPWLIRVLRDEWSRWNIAMHTVSGSSQGRSSSSSEAESIAEILGRMMK